LSTSAPAEAMRYTSGGSAGTTPTASAAAVVSPATAPLAASSAKKKRVKKVKAYVTGYSYYDNTPAGSAAISHGVLHKRAGGRGTYRNPITVAVGHRYVKGRDVLDFRRGTRLYMPYLRKYFMVEDSCGDGPHPERGPCHVHPKGTYAWFDIWIDGKGSGSSRADRCAETITGRHRVEINPRKTRPVKAGPVARNGRCSK
jgi:hypothetical protein